ncbi:MAG: hypothetical protein WBX15_17360 [Thermoanaerobaculia bacterium]
MLPGREYEARKEASRFYREATFIPASELLDHLRRSRFEIASLRQTLIPNEPEGTILDDFGEGGFVVVEGRKVG